MTLIHRNKQ